MLFFGVCFFLYAVDDFFLYLKHMLPKIHYIIGHLYA